MDKIKKKGAENMRNALVLLIFVVCVGCVATTAQKPSTTLLPPVESDLKRFYDDNIQGIMCLAEFLSPQRTIIGVEYDDLTNKGLKVKGVFENSPAKLAGLKVGDMITKVNGKPAAYPFKIDLPTDLEIKRGNDILTVKIVPTLMKTNNAIETKVSVEEIKDDKYIIETIVTGVELNTIQFKTNYERSKWIVSNWATGFWKLNLACLKEKVEIENVAIKFQFNHRNFVNERYQRGHDEFLNILSKRSDIISFAEGNISVQELLDKSMIFINGSREKLLMQ